MKFKKCGIFDYALARAFINQERVPKPRTSGHPMTSVSEPIIGIWGRSPYAPNWVPGAEPMIGGLGEEVP